MIIYGAGLAGLLAANMLRREQPVIHEAQASLPNNHEALLRFRSDVVSRASGIPFRRVTVEKSIRYKGRTISRPDIQLNNLYSAKVTGEYQQRSIADTRPVERYIAPPNLVAIMARSLNIEYNRPLEASEVKARLLNADDPAISTIPMPALMKLIDWPKVDFKYKSIWSAWILVKQPAMDLYQTIYYPDPEIPYYRVSITGNRIILEFSAAPDSRDIQKAIEKISDDFGLHSIIISTADLMVKEQRYGKLLPIEDAERRQFILAMTDEYRIYSLGRFSTWRQILMDDVVNDVHLIEKWISERSAYARRLGS